MPQLSDEELAWCMREFLRGEKSYEIATRVGVGWRTVLRGLMDFYERYGSHGPDFVHIENYRERQVAYYRQALARYQCGGKIAEPPVRRGKTKLRKPKENHRGAMVERRERHGQIDDEGTQGTAQFELRVAGQG